MSNVLSDKDHLCPRLLKGRLEVDTQKDRYTIFAISKCTQHVLNVLMSSPDVTVVFTLVLLLQASVEEHVLLLQCSSTCFVVAVFKHMFCCCSVQAHVLLLQCSSTCLVVAVFKHMFCCCSVQAHILLLQASVQAHVLRAGAAAQRGGCHIPRCAQHALIQIH